MNQVKKVGDALAKTIDLPAHFGRFLEQSLFVDGKQVA